MEIMLSYSLTNTGCHYEHNYQSSYSSRSSTISKQQASVIVSNMAGSALPASVWIKFVIFQAKCFIQPYLHTIQVLTRVVLEILPAPHTFSSMGVSPVNQKRDATTNVTPNTTTPQFVFRLFEYGPQAKRKNQRNDCAVGLVNAVSNRTSTPPGELPWWKF